MPCMQLGGSHSLRIVSDELVKLDLRSAKDVECTATGTTVVSAWFGRPVGHHRRRAHLPKVRSTLPLERVLTSLRSSMPAKVGWR